MPNTRLTKKLIKEIEKKLPSISIEDDGDSWIVRVDNPCCEDFSFDISKGIDDIQYIIYYCDDFDAEEHTVMWYGQNRGEPSSLRTLLDNSDTIKERLVELANFLRYR